jgi:hypothetical protein
MLITNQAARTVADWPVGTRFRRDNILYTKIGDTARMNTFRAETFRNGEQREVEVTIYESDTITLVGPRRN